MYIYIYIYDMYVYIYICTYITNKQTQTSGDGDRSADSVFVDLPSWYSVNSVNFQIANSVSFQRLIVRLISRSLISRSIFG